MALNLPTIPDILPSKVRQAGEALGGYIVGGTHAAVHPLEQTWAAFQKYDPNDAAVIRSLYPDSPANLFNLSTILVGGGKGGRAGAMPFARATPGQASLLRAIYTSSRASKNRPSPTKALFQPLDPSSANLADLIGQPAIASKADVGGGPLPFSWAQNPLLEILRSGKVGPYPTGKVGPGAIVTDLGGRPAGPPGGMDVPPAIGQVGDYWKPLPDEAAAQHLFDILMGKYPQN